MTENEKLAAKLEEALPLLDGLKTGQDCADYAYATASGFQAMTYCPEAFQALRCIPDIIAALRSSTPAADDAAEDRDLWRESERIASKQHDKREAEIVALQARIAELEADNQNLRHHLGVMLNPHWTAAENAAARAAHKGCSQPERSSHDRE